MFQPEKAIAFVKDVANITLVSTYPSPTQRHLQGTVREDRREQTVKGGRPQGPGPGLGGRICKPSREPSPGWCGSVE